jgi:hypothetical protein
MRESLTMLLQPTLSRSRKEKTEKMEKRMGADKKRMLEITGSHYETKQY